MTESGIVAVLETVLPARAFLLLVPQGTPEPYLLLQRIWQGPVNSMCGYMQSDQVRYQIDSYAKTHRQALANIEAAVAALRARPDPPTIDNEQDLYEQDTKLHRSTLELTTWHEPQEVTT
ncbi:DUF3168 domain-containing protein [Paraburkholderia dipogonis]|uniref:DUF3168 domain-containing protein n=1 Tax=Paraburkholderia dipogonis TaxID=1211383 RepID=UPI0038BC5F6E